MRSLLQVVAFAAITLALLGAVVFGLGDRTVFVSPPDSVAEQFMRKVETGRYAQALDHLDTSLKRQVSERDLRRGMQALEHRHGQFEDVRGEFIHINGDDAAASAVLTTRQGEKVPLRFHLKRSQGEWQISDVGSLTRSEPALSRN